MELSSIFRNDICKDRVAIITGGGSGIGYEIARQLGKHGAKIVLMGRRVNVLQDAVTVLKGEGVDATYCNGDVRDPNDAEKVVNTAISTYGYLDTLINSAAGNFLCVAEDLSTKGFKTVLDIDTVGCFNMSHAAFPHLKQSKRGKLINISATLHYRGMLVFTILVILLFIPH